jgi:predicted phage terminase large subunit-like protein
MDSDGTIGSNGSCRFSNNSIHLINGVKELVQSLGGIATLQHTRKREGHPDNYTLRIKISSYNPFRLPRKANKWKPAKIKTLAITDIQPIAKEPGYCIAVDCPTESYITKDYIVTHNTTLFAEYLILFIAAFGYMPGFGEVDYLMYVTDSIENGVRNLRRNIEFRYNNREFLQKLIPNHRIEVISDRDVSYDIDDMNDAVKAGVRFTDVRLELRNYRGDVVVVRGYGVSTGVRGTKEFGKRPTVAILDDLLSDDDARSSTIIDSVNDIIYKAVDKALHPTVRKTIYLGTPFNANDPLYVAIESGAWKSSVFPVCEKFPVTKSEFKGAWEDRFTYMSILRQYATAVKVNRPAAFYQEMMLRIHSEEDVIIPAGSIILVDDDIAQDNLEESNIYITTDFATSTKSKADFSTMVIWKHDSNDNLTIIDGYCKRSRMEDNIEALFEFNEKYKPQLVGIEISGQQAGFVDWINMESRRRKETIILAKQKGREHTNDVGIRPTKNKILRLERVAPLVRRGKVRMAKSMANSSYGKELLEELKLASSKSFMSKHDDAIDAFSQIMDLNIYKPSAYVEEKKEKGLSFKERFVTFLNDDKKPTTNSYIV